MVLSRLTKITGPGVATDTNWVGNNADFTGITTTATSFNIGVTTIHSNLIEAHNIKSTGIITATGGSFSGNVTAVDGTFSGNVSIAGTLTYEDVTNIDAVGIITAPALDVDDFLDVGSNIKLGNAGVITATSFVGSGAALTGIDATSIKDSGGNVKIQAQASGAIHTGISTFDTIKVGSGVTIESNGQATFTGIVTFGSGSTTIDNNVVNVGTALTLGHTQGLQFHTQNLHAQGFEVNQINASGIITATTFSGSGASLTNLNGSNIASGTVPVARIGTGTKNTSTFYRGDGTFATVTAPAITSINSASNNRIVTSDGGTTVTAEANFTYNGTNVKIGSGTPAFGVGGGLEIDTGSAATLRLEDSGSTSSFEIQNSSSVITQNMYNSQPWTIAYAGSEKLRITSGGSLLVGKTVGTMATAGTRIDPQSTLITGSSTSTNLATASGAALTLINNSATDNNFSNIGGYNSNSLVTSQINFVNTSHSSRTGDITFMTHNGSSMPERLRIDSSGRLLVNGASANNAFTGGDDLIIGNTSSGTRSGITLISNSSNDGGIYFSDGTSSGNAHVQGQIVYDHSGNFLRLYTSATEKMRIHSDGKITMASGNVNAETSTGLLLLDKNLTAESDVSDKNNYHLVIRSQTNSNTSKLGIAFANTTDDTHVGAAILHHRTSTDSIGDLAFYTSPSSGTLTEKMKIDRHGRITKPLNPAFKSNNTGTYGGVGSLTTTVANVGILQAGEQYDRGGNYDTSTYLFTCPVDGIYLVNIMVSLGAVGTGRHIFVMAHTPGGGSTPLSNYYEVIDGSTSNYANYSYCEPWYFTSGTTIGVGKNSHSGYNNNYQMQWGVHLLA